MAAGGGPALGPAPRPVDPGPGPGGALPGAGGGRAPPDAPPRPRPLPLLPTTRPRAAGGTDAHQVGVVPQSPGGHPVFQGIKRVVVKTPGAPFVVEGQREWASRGVGAGLHRTGRADVPRHTNLQAAYLTCVRAAPVTPRTSQYSKHHAKNILPFLFISRYVLSDDELRAKPHSVQPQDDGAAEVTR